MSRLDIDNKTNRWRRFWLEWRAFLVFIAMMFFFRSAIADWNHVPSGSMLPTIIEGDRIWVNKLAYDVKIPFTEITLATRSDPQHGDIVVFKSPRDGTRLVKRLVGLPGDIVEVRDNQLSINGQLANYVPLDTDFGPSLDPRRLEAYSVMSEDLFGRVHPILTQKMGGQGRPNFGPLTVREGYYLMMGDNRDNSRDSRWFGEVRRELIIGRANSVVMSLNPERFYLPRGSRFFVDLP